ncbi:HPr family phosphocarrier protein [Mycetocola tolaasinivorans]|uniref:Phosphocarrier protein HPr n=1 Tax=Mycetocola tolaasinivorans TaxID=76635 RepID=A0A3L7A769_9MICO|nr:HPr family phosphocarrier protein [Mycetocola tolaasinivorans]RLP75974.1 HPr family phosphocarrier protein [Mycetocola tolaasinivorans]
MATRTAIIASSIGLHSRPAAIFVEAVEDSGLEVEIGRPGEPTVDAGSILGVMALGARNGETVELTAEGPETEAVLDRLVELLNSDLDAE